MDSGHKDSDARKPSGDEPDYDSDADFVNEDDNADGWYEEWELSVKCLFCDETFVSHEKAFLHLSRGHGFDILEMKSLHKLDSFSYIKMINFIRKERPDVDALKRAYKFGTAPWDDDAYMEISLPDDQLLGFYIEGNTEQDLPGLSSSSKVAGSGAEPSKDQSLTSSGSCDEQTITLPLAEYNKLMADLHSANQKTDLLCGNLKEAVQQLEAMRSAVKTMGLSSAANECPAAGGDSKPKSSRSGCDDDDDDMEVDLYFQSYDHYGIHEEMLKDTVRTLAYRDAMLLNRNVIEKRTVLDIGCGTSILSMFAARAGAGRVLAVDQSEIVYKAMDIVRENNFSETVHCIKGKIEEVDLPCDEVDVIVSEWMGYFLLFESMLDSVIWARDRYLKKSSGVMLPSSCDILFGGFESPDMVKQRIDYWDDVYDFKMTCLKTSVLSEADVLVLEAESVLTDICTVKRDGQLTGFFGYFDSIFDLPNRVVLSTGPNTKATHWKQTVFLLEKPVDVKKGEVIDGTITCKKSPKDRRSLVIGIRFQNQKLKYYMD